MRHKTEAYVAQCEKCAVKEEHNAQHHEKRAKRRQRHANFYAKQKRGTVGCQNLGGEQEKLEEDADFVHRRATFQERLGDG
jgi:hypothetical protein